MPIESKEDFKDFKESFLGAFEKAFDEVLLFIQNEAATNAPWDRGLLSGSIAIEKKSRFEATVGSDLIYAKAMEYGSQQNPWTPPLDPIKKWAKRKGIPEEFVFAIWKSISTKGIKPHPYLIPAFKKGLERWDQILQKHMDKEMAKFK